MYRNHVALNPLLKKCHVHTEKEESVEHEIEEGIDEFYERNQERYEKDNPYKSTCN
jgi:hypothetical protein